VTCYKAQKAFDGDKNQVFIPSLYSPPTSLSRRNIYLFKKTGLGIVLWLPKSRRI